MAQRKVTAIPATISLYTSAQSERLVDFIKVLKVFQDGTMIHAQKWHSATVGCLFFR